ncbi:formylglycine-generating enzyme family protein [Candidatus Poribacteria bacterium]|nr:formylglycine-generating enzyme family protein [Candidatus Poribacteria bacterium]
MGSNDGGDWSLYYPTEQPVHAVTIPNALHVGIHEVTQAQWAAIMGSNPAFFTGNSSRPVERVSWNDAVNIFLPALNAHILATGQGAANLRLPSEAEWEYACRAGSTTRFFFGDSSRAPNTCGSCDLDGHAWFCANGLSTTHAVGASGHANSWGLYDMHGNVWEWVQDWYHIGYAGAPTDGSAWISPLGTHRIFRGGSWSNYPMRCRSTDRGGDDPAYSDARIGFRLVAEQ